MSRRPPFWGQPGGQRDSQYRNEMRRTSSAPSPNRGHSGNKPQIDFNQFLTLSQVRGEVMNYAVYIAGRAKLAELYSGAPQEEWFLREIIASIDTMAPYSGGVSFLHKVSCKIENVPPDWTRAIIERAMDMLKFEASVPLLINMIERSKDEPMTIAKVKNFLLVFEKRSDPVYLKFFRRIVQLYRNDDSVLYFLFGFQWEARRELYQYFVILVQYVPFEKLRQSVTNLVNSPLTYAGDPYLACIYAAVLKYVEPERERMMDYLVNNIQYYMRSAESLVVLKEVINLSSMKQKEALLLKFEGLLRQTTAFPPFLEEAFDHLLVSVPSITRLAFLERNQLLLKQYASKRLPIILNYMERVMKQ